MAALPFDLLTSGALRSSSPRIFFVSSSSSSSSSELFLLLLFIFPPSDKDLVASSDPALRGVGVTTGVLGSFDTPTARAATKGKACTRLTRAHSSKGYGARTHTHTKNKTNKKTHTHNARSLLRRTFRLLGFWGMPCVKPGSNRTPGHARIPHQTSRRDSFDHDDDYY